MFSLTGKTKLKTKPVYNWNFSVSNKLNQKLAVWNALNNHWIKKEIGNFNLIKFGFSTSTTVLYRQAICSQGFRTAYMFMWSRLILNKRVKCIKFCVFSLMWWWPFQECSKNFIYIGSVNLHITPIGWHPSKMYRSSPGRVECRFMLSIAYINLHLYDWQSFTYLHAQNLTPDVTALSKKLSL